MADDDGVDMAPSSTRLMNFVSEEQLAEARRSRGARVDDGTAQRDRPLYEILKENKDKRDAEFNERFKHLSIDVLGKRSGYLKGYGIRKSTYAIQSQVVPNSEEVALTEVVADQAKLLADYAKKFETMMLFMATKNGVDPATIPALISSNENGEDTSIGLEDGIST